MNNVLLSKQKSKAQTMMMTSDTVRLIAFIAIFGAVMIITLANLRTNISSNSLTFTNESNTFIAGSLILPNALTPNTYTNTSIIAINNGTNNTMVFETNFFSDANGSVWMKGGTNINTNSAVNISYSATSPSQAQNAIDNSTRSINNTFVQLPLFGTILGLLLVVGIIIILFRFRGREGSQSV